MNSVKEGFAMFYLPTINMKATGARIKQLREESGYSISRLSEILGVSQQAICKWQKGITIPTIDHCIELCELFQVKIEDIIVVNQPIRGLSVREDDRSSFLSLLAPLNL